MVAFGGPESCKSYKPLHESMQTNLKRGGGAGETHMNVIFFWCFSTHPRPNPMGDFKRRVRRPKSSRKTSCP